MPAIRRAPKISTAAARTIRQTSPKVKPVPPPPGKRKNASVSKKLKELDEWLSTPYPQHQLPTPEVAKSVHDALKKAHNPLPSDLSKPVNYDMTPTPDGSTPDLLNNLIRTILSQNTNTANENRAYAALSAKYGPANYLAMHKATLPEIVDTLSCGGLANVKGKAIKLILDEVAQKQVDREGLKSDDELGALNINYLADLDDDAALRKLVQFHRVGPKTANGLVMFGLGRDRMAVDTHILRISKSLGWVPEKADAGDATRHLNQRLPAHLKKPLHLLMIKHGQACRRCAAGGRLVPERFDQDIDIAQEDCPIRTWLKDQ